MNKKVINNWLEETENIKKLIKISLPLNIFLEEASSISGFIEKYWEATDEQPGLASAMPIVTFEMAAEIIALVAEISRLHNETVKLQKSELGEGGAGQLARVWIREMQHFMKWANHQQETAGKPGLSVDLTKFSRAYLKDRKSAASLAEWIENISAIVRKDETIMMEVPGYAPSMLTQGEAIKEKLLVTRRGRPRGSDEKQQTLKLRRRLTHVLAERVRRVRSAARFVFRNHPEIRKRVTSDFERRRRQQSRAAKENGLLSSRSSLESPL